MSGMNKQDKMAVFVVTLLLLVTFVIVAIIIGLMETTTIEAPPIMVKSPLSTHVLDISRGQPAAGVPVSLWFKPSLSEGQWIELSKVETDKDGRATGLVSQEKFLAGLYRLKFNTATYFTNRKVFGFYPYIEVTFSVRSTLEHYHVPILLSPYGYSTYRGS